MPGPTESPQLFADLQRQMANVVRMGTIADVDHSATPPLVRVQLTEKGSTDWRPYVELRAGKTGTWNPPTVGECVLFLSPNGLTEGGYALPGLPTENHPAPSSDPNKTVTKYPDGAVVEYDHVAHKLKVTLPAAGTADIEVPDAITVKCKTADVTAANSAKVHSQEITLDAPKTIATGELVVRGLLTFLGGMAGSGTGPGGKTAEIDGDMSLVNGHSLTTDGGDIVAGDISLQHHRTKGIVRGGDISDGPVQ
ncbi:phage baseplate assembly protein V [Variovorax sp.]|uniref:phage baseplate assembly protein V n=1 Tax=Variovorax sp. TaxID=1871043 RepID=UPI003BADB212